MSSKVIKIESVEDLEKILDKLAEKLPDRTVVNVFVMGDIVAGNDCTSLNTGTENYGQEAQEKK